MRRRVVQVPLVALVLAAAAVTGAALLRAGRPGATIESPAGGFTLSLPDEWVIAGSPHPSSSVWAEAHHPSLLGPADAWVWVARGTASGTENALTAAVRASRDDVRRRWGKVPIVEEAVRFAGADAVRLRYSHRASGFLGLLPGDRIQELRLVVVRSSQVYEIGVGGWRSLPAMVSELGNRIELRTPTGKRSVAGPGFAVDLPAGFNVRPSPYPDAPGATWIATAAPAPDEHWSMMWAFDDSVARTSADSLTALGRDGRLLEERSVTIGGKTARRFAWEQLIDGRPAQLITWHFEGPDGKAWQLLIGGRRPVDKTAAVMERTFRFSADLGAAAAR